MTDEQACSPNIDQRRAVDVAANAMVLATGVHDMGQADLLELVPFLCSFKYQLNAFGELAAANKAYRADVWASQIERLLAPQVRAIAGALRREFPDDHEARDYYLRRLDDHFSGQVDE